MKIVTRADVEKLSKELESENHAPNVIGPWYLALRDVGKGAEQEAQAIEERREELKPGEANFKRLEAQAKKQERSKLVDQEPVTDMLSQSKPVEKERFNFSDNYRIIKFASKDYLKKDVVSWSVEHKPTKSFIRSMIKSKQAAQNTARAFIACIRNDGIEDSEKLLDEDNLHAGYTTGDVLHFMARAADGQDIMAILEEIENDKDKYKKKMDRREAAREKAKARPSDRETLEQGKRLKAEKGEPTNPGITSEVMKANAEKYYYSWDKYQNTITAYASDDDRKKVVKELVSESKLTNRQAVEKLFYVNPDGWNRVAPGTYQIELVEQYQNMPANSTETDWYYLVVYNNGKPKLRQRFSDHNKARDAYVLLPNKPRQTKKLQHWHRMPGSQTGTTDDGKYRYE